MQPRTEHTTGLRGTRRAAGLAAAAAALLFVLGTAGAAAAEPGDVLWRDFAQRTPGGEDAYAAVAVAPSGQVCAVGSTAAAPGDPGDVLVCAFEAGGAVQWRRAWTWPGRSDDVATAVARDSRGGYVVAGSSGSCWLLLKYTSRGYLQWVRRGSSGSARSSLAAVALDGSGAVYAAGSVSPSGGSSRLLVLKRSPAGAVRWQRTYDAAAGDASAAGVAVAGGSAYVAGRTATGRGTSAAVLVAYSASGARRWTDQYSVPGVVETRAEAVCYANGPVAAGWSTTTGGADDGFVVAWGMGGTRRWVAGYDAGGAGADRFRGLAADTAGRLCAAGDVATADGSRALAACFDAAGTPLWSHTGPGAQGFSVCPVAGGFAFATGVTDLGAARVTAGGAAAWERTVSPAGYHDFRPAAVRAAGGSYLYAAGSAAVAGGGRAALLVRYRP